MLAGLLAQARSQLNISPAFDSVPAGAASDSGPAAGSADAFSSGTDCRAELALDGVPGAPPSDDLRA